MRKPFLWFVSLLFFLILGQTLPALQASTLEHKAEQGFLDLTSWNFSENGNVLLNGQWEFYWNQFLSPSDFIHNQKKLTPEFIDVPGIWNDKGSENKPRLTGFATYRIRIKLPPGWSDLGLKLDSIESAYQIWINGHLAGGSGRLGKSMEEETAMYDPQVFPVLSGQNQFVELIIQISSFHRPDGGLAKPVLLGKYRNILSARDQDVFKMAFVMGTLAIMGLYHLGLFFLRRESKSYLYFAVFCFALSLDSLVSGDFRRVVFDYLGDFETYFRIFHLSWFLVVTMVSAFIYEMFPKEFSKKFLYILFLVHLVAAVIVLFTRYIDYFDFLLPIFLFDLSIVLYIIYSLIRAYLNKKQGSLLILGAFILILVTAVNDVLTAEFIIFTGYYRHFGLLAMVFAQAYVLAVRDAENYRLIEKLSSEVQEKNSSLIRMDQIKDEFLSKTSHEFRTPLNGMMGLLDSVLSGTGGELNPIVRQNLQMVLDRGKRLYNLVNDILDFSKLKNLDLQLHFTPVNLHDIVDVVLKLSRGIRRDTNIQLVNEIPQSFIYVKADENRLQQILLNLIGNAVKFTPNGYVRISARIIEDNMVEVSVKDTGIGIDKKDFERIFQDFEQSQPDVYSKMSGTGLGLSITRHLVELHGGTIRVESEVNRGSVFSFSLPATKETVADAPLPEFSDQPSPSERRGSEELRSQMTTMLSEMLQGMQDCQIEILVVDDEPVNMQLISNFLSLENIHVTLASNGQEALTLLDEGYRPYLILMDVIMPHLNGYDACREIRSRYTAAEMPVIMMTGKNRPADLVEGYKNGANDYLIKPFVRSELLSRVSLHLKLAKAHRDAAAYSETLQRTVEERTSELNEALKTISTQSDERGELIHLLCHDLANPVGSSLKCVEMIRENPSCADDFMHPMQLSLRNSMAVIDSIQKFMVMERRAMEGLLQEANLSVLIESSLSILQYRFDEKFISYELNLDEGLIVKVDPAIFVNSILNNILTNAIKFSPEHSTINISATKENEMVLLKIKDQGIGIPSEMVGILFSFNKRTNRLGTKGERGTGFGMPLMKKFVTYFGGSIEVQSVTKEKDPENHGTEMIIRLKG